MSHEPFPGLFALVLSCGWLACSSTSGRSSATGDDAGISGDSGLPLSDADTPDADVTDGRVDPEAGAIVSFSQNVLPIFQRSCATGGAMCHGDPSVATNGKGTGGNRTYLGPAYGAGDAGLILSGMVGVPSFEDPATNVVTAGSPSTSYLMLKMDGDLSGLAGPCAAGTLGQCGAPMPLNAPTLAPAARDLVRSWISQGAQNN